MGANDYLKTIESSVNIDEIAESYRVRPRDVRNGLREIGDGIGSAVPDPDYVEYEGDGYVVTHAERSVIMAQAKIEYSEEEIPAGWDDVAKYADSVVDCLIGVGHACDGHHDYYPWGDDYPLVVVPEIGGNHCTECGFYHNHWERVESRIIESDNHSGIAEVYKCQFCGAHVEFFD